MEYDESRSYAIAYALLALGGLVGLCVWRVFFAHRKNEIETIRLVVNFGFLAAFVIWVIFFAR